MNLAFPEFLRILIREAANDCLETLGKNVTSELWISQNTNEKRSRILKNKRAIK